MIYLCQTDTTAGFCSQNLKELNLAKNRDESTPCLITITKFNNIKNFTRVPRNFRNFIRNSKKTTFIYPNKISIRVVKNHRHTKFLDSIGGWAYSSSANLHGLKFNPNIASKIADVIVDDKFFEDSPSKIYKLSLSGIRRIR